MKRKLLIFLLVMGCTSLVAHEFWIEPLKFTLRKGESLYLHFKVGENFEGANWKGTQASVESLQLYYGHIKDDLQPLIPDSIPGDSLNLQFYDEGTALVSYQSTNKHIELEPASFLAYLEEDGLQEAIDYRKEHGETDSLGRENYKRCAKTLFQIGAVKDDVYKRQCGHDLEFVPLQHPYALKKDQTLKFSLLYKNTPLPNATVKLWHRINGKTNMTEHITDQNGVVELPLKLFGKYLLTSVHIKRVDNEQNADWQSYWASFTWGY
jgi:uncharacterized GH25 family protein